MKKLISIVIPVYNEELVLKELAKRLQKIFKKFPKYNFEVIIVENGSTDSSFTILLKLHKNDRRFKILQLSRNFGCDGAIAAGLKYAQGEAAIVMNADLQDPPEMIPKFIQKWEEGFEIVYGIIKKRKGISFTRKILSSLFYKIIYFLTNKVVPQNVSDFRLIDKKVYLVVNQMEEKNKFLRGIIVWTGFKQIGIPYQRPPRFAGKSKADFLTALTVAANGIFSFSYFPLRLTIALGFFLSLCSFFMILIKIYFFLNYHQSIKTSTLTNILMLFLFGMLFFLLGIIGEYLARIYEEVKKRPNFITKATVGLKTIHT